MPRLADATEVDVLHDLRKMTEKSKGVDINQLAESINEDIERFLDEHRVTRETLNRVISV